ncbi:FCD domain-containing protein [Szabonella alba]|uniref:FCD domain-containing protein n=1 Tax=Szabonella alba TaxID=2804194 RepID=A0A8K0V7D9_9RHOB|nr:FCD domain-containing protein [Szabonella alba]MBL4916733.1 FCD domain-containing protein [Szabonella alba]
MWDVPNQKIRRRKLYEEAAEKIEEWIRTGHLKVGDRLPAERELAEMLGIGRTSVREALFALSKKGVLELRNGGRAVVTEPDATVILGEFSGVVANLLRDREGLRNFQDAREFWESAIVRRAAMMARASDIADLERHLAENKRALADVDAFARSDVAFHNRVAAICGNPLFDALNATLAEWLTEQRLTSLRQAGSAARAYASHAQIFEAIRARDPAAAEQAMREHLSEVSQFYWRTRHSAG